MPREESALAGRDAPRTNLEPRPQTATARPCLEGADSLDLLTVSFNSFPGLTILLHQSCSLRETSCGCRRSDQDCHGPCGEKRNCHLSRHQPFQPKSSCSNEMGYFAAQNRPDSRREEIREKHFLAFHLLAHFFTFCVVSLFLCVWKRWTLEICLERLWKSQYFY